MSAQVAFSSAREQDRCPENGPGLPRAGQGQARARGGQLSPAHEVRAAVLGAHPAVAASLDWTAYTCAALGRWDEAIELQNRAFDKRSRLLQEIFVIGSERQRLLRTRR